MVTGCISTKAEISKPIIKDLDHSKGRELFEIKDEDKVYFYGVANLVPEDKLVSIMIHIKENSPREPAYIELIYNNRLFIVEMPILSSYG